MAEPNVCMETRACDVNHPARQSQRHIASISLLFPLYIWRGFAWISNTFGITKCYIQVNQDARYPTGKMNYLRKVRGCLKNHARSSAILCDCAEEPVVYAFISVSIGK